MKDHINAPRDFKTDYAILHLENTADWATVRAHHRKLVQRWHPDKFLDKPRERIHAQKHFIEITKSYNRLKEFQKQHGRMPYAYTAEPSKADPQQHGSVPNAGSCGHIDPGNLNLGTLSRDDDKIDERILKPSPVRKIIWTTTASIVIISTIILFFILDQRASKRNLQKSQQVLREVPESAFNPSQSEIRRGLSKGAFISLPD